jgi:triosephosphate isomerase
MGKKIVAGNWKMNNTLSEGEKLTSEIINMVNDEVKSDVTVILCPPFIHLTTVVKHTKDIANIHVAAQNCSQYDSGAYTGEVSAKMLASIGVSHVLIGHSERREFFNETNVELAEKIDQALANNLTPLFCCGEPLDIREEDEQYDYVTEQISDSLFHLSKDQIGKVVIAYEPIWAIGTGKTATAEQAQEMHAKIRAFVASKYGKEVAEATSILYGGSAKPANAPELFAKADVDGGLIGGASLKSRDFVDIIKSF